MNEEAKSKTVVSDDVSAQAVLDGDNKTIENSRSNSPKADSFINRDVIKTETNTADDAESQQYKETISQSKGTNQPEDEVNLNNEPVDENKDQVDESVQLIKSEQAEADYFIKKTRPDDNDDGHETNACNITGGSVLSAS